MRTISISLFFAAALLCAVSCGNSASKGSNSASATKSEAAPTDTSTYINVGDLAPDFTVAMLDGSSVTLSEQKGKVVLITFWATWCPPCNEEFRAIPEKLLKPMEGVSDFVFLPISREEKVETVTAKMEAFAEDGISFLVGTDPSREIYGKYAKNTIPRNYVIGKDGKVAYKTVGYSEEEFAGVVAKIQELVK